MSSALGPGALEQQQQALRGDGSDAPPRGVGVIGGSIGEYAKKDEKEPDYIPKAIPLGADMRTGIDAVARLLQGVAGKPQSRMSYLFERYGEDNVMSITPEARPHDIFVRTWVPMPTYTEEEKKTNSGSYPEWFWLSNNLPLEYFDVDDADNVYVYRWVQVDPQSGGVDLLEPLDWIGDIAQSGPSMIGAKVGAGLGGPGGALAGELVGELVGSVGRQAASAMLPGEEGIAPEERVGQTVSDVAMGAAGAGLGRIIGKGFDAARPHNVLARTLRKTDSPEYMSEGLELSGRGVGVPESTQSYEQIARERGREGLLRQFDAERAARSRTGSVNLSAGQITGGDLALRFESMVRESPEAGSYVKGEDIKRILQLENTLGQSIERLGGQIESESVGQLIADTANAYFRSIRSARGKAANVLFGRASDALGRGEVIRTTNTINEIDKLIDTHSGAFSRGTSTSDKILRGLKKTRLEIGNRRIDSLTKQFKEAKVTVNEFKKDLSRFSRIMNGDGTFIDDIPKAEDRYLAGRVYDALLRDLDETVARGQLPDEGRKALVQARRAWARMSQVIDDTANRVIRDTLRLDLDAAPETIANKIVGSGWTNSQVRNTIRFLEKIDPRVANQTRAYALQHMMDKSPILSETFRGRGATVSPAMLRSALLKNSDRLDALFYNTTERARIESIRKIAGRLADSVGMSGGSQTAPKLWVRRVFENLGGAIDPKAAASQIYTFMTTKRLAKALTSADGQRAVLDLLKLGEGKGDAIRALSRVAAYNATEDMDPYFTPQESREMTRDEIVQRAMKFAPGGI